LRFEKLRDGEDWNEPTEDPVSDGFFCIQQ
jgi:hypothetical protein